MYLYNTNVKLQYDFYFILFLCLFFLYYMFHVCSTINICPTEAWLMLGICQDAVYSKHMLSICLTYIKHMLSYPHPRYNKRGVLWSTFALRCAYAVHMSLMRTWSKNVELGPKCFYICQDLKMSELSTPHGTFSTLAELRPVSTVPPCSIITIGLSPNFRTIARSSY